MKINCWSDLHEKIPVKEDFDDIGDTLIVAGDLIFDPDDVKAYKTMIQAISLLPQENKIVIPGNHDPDAETFVREYLKEYADDRGIDILIDEWLTIDDVKFHGFPWSTQFGNWPWMRNESGLERAAALIDEDVDVLVCHGPPYGRLDKTYSGDNAGSTSLEKRIQVVRPKLVVFGHIHEGHGVEVDGDIKYVNAAYGYKREQFSPITVEI